MNELPTDVTAHVLPTGGGGSAKDDSLLSYRDFSAVVRRIDQAYDASRRYLDAHL
jgi:NTE family protein